LLGAFPATAAFFIGWYARFNSTDELAVTTIFVALFFVVFISPSLRKEERGSSITEVLLPLANAAFASLAIYSLFEDAGHHDLLPWFAVLFGAIYLGLMRLPQARVAAAIHLSLAIVFLTIAIPLKASGRWITVGWLAEGVALLWISARLSAPAEESTPASSHRVLRWLGIGALTLGFLGLIVQPFWLFHPIETAFFNRRFATALFGIAALGSSVWISLDARRHPDAGSPDWMAIAGGCIIALNLVAILACVRELDTVWRSVGGGNVDDELKKSLAISGFLMLYGAGLLAVGFWKRSSFIRWQALALMAFTIGKTFIYDLRNLSEGYRVASFLALGALLMAVSFAYQKDWLGLRDAHHGSPPSSGRAQGAGE
jgi:uncharacterized membrane protein